MEVVAIAATLKKTMNAIASADFILRLPLRERPVSPRGPLIAIEVAGQCRTCYRAAPRVQAETHAQECRSVIAHSVGSSKLLIPVLAIVTVVTTGHCRTRCCHSQAHLANAHNKE